MFSHLASRFKTLPASNALVDRNAGNLRIRNHRNRFRTKSHTIALIDIDYLVKSNIRGVILDLDNTIVSEDDQYLCPNSEWWIEQAKNSGLQFYILSNGKRRYRVRYWSARLNIAAISPARKPLPPSFRTAFKAMNLAPEQVVVIGDSFHTDVLGALLNGCHCIQVASLPHPPRWWERILGSYVQTPYPRDLELWNFDPLSYSK